MAMYFDPPGLRQQYAEWQQDLQVALLQWPISARTVAADQCLAMWHEIWRLRSLLAEDDNDALS